MSWSFNANQFAPEQVGSAHPVGKFIATISDTGAKPTKDGNNGYLAVEFKTEAGSITGRYNVWNSSAEAVRIAHGQLSALCYATGIFQLSDGAPELRGGRCMIEVGKQATGDYVEIKKVFDVNGNEPGKPGSAAPQGQANQFVQPQGQQPQNNQAWDNPAQQPPAQQPQQQPPANAWGNPAQAQQPAPSQGWQAGAVQQPPQGNPPGGWQQQQPPAQAGAVGGTPPWQR